MKKAIFLSVLFVSISVGCSKEGDDFNSSETIYKADDESPNGIWGWIKELVPIEVEFGMNTHGDCSCCYIGLCTITVGGGSGDGNSLGSGSVADNGSVWGVQNGVVYAAFLKNDMTPSEYQENFVAPGGFEMLAPIQLPANACAELGHSAGYTIGTGVYPVVEENSEAVIVKFE